METEKFERLCEAARDEAIRLNAADKHEFAARAHKILCEYCIAVDDADENPRDSHLRHKAAVARKFVAAIKAYGGPDFVAIFGRYERITPFDVQ